MAKGGVGTLDGARPQPGDHGEILDFGCWILDFGLGGVAIGAVGVADDLHLRVEVADSPIRLVAHPLAVVAHVFGQTGCALPGGFRL